MKANSDSSFKTLTSPVRIWNLDDGAYRLPAGCVVYYYGAEDTSNSITTSTTGALFITHYSTTYKNWFLFCGNTSTTRYLYNGYSKVDGGASKQFNIGSSYLTGISSYVKNQLDYATSNTTYALSAYQGYVLNQGKQTKMATDLTADLYFTNGTAPTLADGSYYANGHQIYINNVRQQMPTNCIFDFFHEIIDEGEPTESTWYYIYAVTASGTIYLASYDTDSQIWGYSTSPIVTRKNIDTTIPNNAQDYRVPSTKLLKTQLGNKEDVSNKVTSISSSSTNTQYPSAKCVYDALSGAGIPTLTSPIRIWDLGVGLYKLPESCVVYYNGSSNTTDQYVVNSSAFLFVTSFENSGVSFKDWILFGRQTSNIKYAGGSTSQSTGTIIFDYSTGDLVSSTAISTIWKGSQNDYDAITTKDPNTLYLIEEA